MSIISGKLEDIRNYLDVEVHPVVSPDRWDVYAALCDMVDDTIAMLKAQEPKPPIIKENSYGWKFYYCPSCGKEFYQNNKFSFCEKCGQAIDWSDSNDLLFNPNGCV